MSTIKLIAFTVLFILSMLYGVLSAQQGAPLVSFEAQPGANHSVLIEWKAKPQADTLSFELQRSRDQKVWERIVTEPAQSAHLYSFTDSRPGEGLNYYRVGQVTRNKNIAFTGVKWVQVNKTGVLFIWPNPARDMLYIKTPFVTGRIDIVDSGGKPIFNINITALVANVPTDRLLKGVYFIYVKHGNEILVEKFVKK